jgi:Na+-transporting NADH:ubiquinone oxidoreductase subunit A
MSEYKLKKGYDIKIAGKSELKIENAPQMTHFAIKPTDFRLLKPKMEIEVGASVKAGTVLFHDKSNPDIKFTSPVSGKVSEIVRGDRRLILAIVIESDAKFESLDYSKCGMSDLQNLDSSKIKEQIIASGLWPALLQRPYNRIADVTKTPRDIFISAFDSAPLAGDVSLLLDGKNDYFQAGVVALGRLTSGKVNVSVDSLKPIAPAIANCKTLALHKFSGPHPAGTVGAQIHHIKPINKGEVVWTVKPSDVIAIGKLFLDGKLCSEVLINIAGENALLRPYYKTYRGAKIANLISSTRENSRIISGNVLTGHKVNLADFVGFFDNTVTIIPEGNQKEFLGWAKPGADRESYSSTYLSKLFPKKEYSHTTNLHGGHRSMVQTGYYEKVMPMDIYPMQLLKAMLAEDIEMMEGLGIYEVVEEDFALCEYICPSKSDLQEIVRESIEYFIHEMQ